MSISALFDVDELRRNRLNRENRLVEVEGLRCCCCCCVGGEGERGRDEDSSGDCEPGDWSSVVVIACCCQPRLSSVEVGRAGGGSR